MPTARKHLWQYRAAAYSPSGSVTDAKPFGSICGSMKASTSTVSGPQRGQGTSDGSLRYAISSSSASASVKGPLGCGSVSASSLATRFVIVLTPLGVTPAPGSSLPGRYALNQQ